MRNSNNSSKFQGLAVVLFTEFSDDSPFMIFSDNDSVPEVQNIFRVASGYLEEIHNVDLLKILLKDFRDRTNDEREIMEVLGSFVDMKVAELVKNHGDSSDRWDVGYDWKERKSVKNFRPPFMIEEAQAILERIMMIPEVALCPTWNNPNCAEVPENRPWLTQNTLIGKTLALGTFRGVAFELFQALGAKLLRRSMDLETASKWLQARQDDLIKMGIEELEVNRRNVNPYTNIREFRAATREFATSVFGGADYEGRIAFRRQLHQAKNNIAATLQGLIPLSWDEENGLEGFYSLKEKASKQEPVALQLQAPMGKVLVPFRTGFRGTPTEGLFNSHSFVTGIKVSQDFRRNKSLADDSIQVARISVRDDRDPIVFDFNTIEENPEMVTVRYNPVYFNTMGLYKEDAPRRVKAMSPAPVATTKTTEPVQVKVEEVAKVEEVQEEVPVSETPEFKAFMAKVGATPRTGRKNPQMVEAFSNAKKNRR